jgi:iron complex outermembrane receptor protein
MLFARGRNLGDDEIRLSTSFLRGFAPEAGRSLEVGIRLSY